MELKEDLKGWQVVLASASPRRKELFEQIGICPQICPSNAEEKKDFERRGMDIYTTIQIPYTTAVFGGEARVSTLYGDVVCKIKEGTQSGSKLRLRGKGMVSMKDANVHGDHYATIEIAVPRSLNRTARQKLMEYKEAC